MNLSPAELILLVFILSAPFFYVIGWIAVIRWCVEHAK